MSTIACLFISIESFAQFPPPPPLNTNPGDQGDNNTGEIVGYETREAITVRGDIQVIGNDILGVRGQFFLNGRRNSDLRNFTPNGEYNGNRNNGGTGSGNPFPPTRAYIDIDSDRNDPRFSPLFTRNGVPTITNTETDYSGNINNNGRPNKSNNGAFPNNVTGTFSSSAARFELENECSRVVRAYLYWGGILDQKQFCRNGTVSDFSCATYTEVKILPPFADKYYDISINPANTSSNRFGVQLQTEVLVDGTEDSFWNRRIARVEGTPGDRVADFPYVCRANVTELFRNLQESGNPDDIINGYWTVANVQAQTGTRGRGLAGGWTLAIVYEDIRPEFSERNITFFDGYSTIRNGESAISFTTPNFDTDPNADPIQATIASAGIEGDRLFRGDQFLIETETTKGVMPPVSNPNLPTGVPLSAVRLRESGFFSVPSENNFFNSTISNQDITGVYRQPNSRNTLGYDTDQYDLINGGNSVLNNGKRGGVTDRNATFWLGTDGESFSNFFIAFAVDVVAPEVVVLKEALRADGTLIDQDTSINFEDEITYRLTITNEGNDTAIIESIQDYIPANSALIPYSDGSFFRSSLNNLNFNRTTATPPDMNVITPFPVETELISITGFPELRFVGCAGINCASVESIEIEFRVQVVSECSPRRNACFDRLQNVALPIYRGELNTRRIDDAISFFQRNSGCNSFDLGPTIQLPTRVSRCESTIGTICENNGSTVLSSGLGFDSYNLYFYPIADIDTNNDGRIDANDDRNGNGIIDDADFPTDPVQIIRTQIPIGGATPTTGTTPIPSVTPQQFTVDQSGIYLIEGVFTAAECNNSVQSFNVDFFSNGANNQPLMNPILNGTLLPECVTNNQSIIQFELCNTSLVIPTTFPDGSILVWSRVDETTCDSALQTNTNNCPVVGPVGCEYQEIERDVVDGTAENSSYEVTQAGNYSLEVTLPLGGCNATFFFNVIEFTSDVTISVPTNVKCNETPIVRVNQLPASGSPSLRYSLEYFTGMVNGSGTTIYTSVKGPVTDADIDYDIFEVPRPNAGDPQRIPIRVIATPIFTGGVSIGTSCAFELDDDVTFSEPEIMVFDVSRSPTCEVDSDDTDGIDNDRADLEIEVSDNNEQYVYQLINTITNTVVSTSAGVSENSFNFANVATGIPYKIRVFLNGTAVEADPTVDVSTNPCVLETATLPAIDPPLTITGSVGITKILTCEPAELEVSLTNGVRFSIPELGIADRTQTTFRVDNIINAPVLSPEDVANGVVIPVDPDLFYIDFSTSTGNFTLIIEQNPSCVKTITVPNALAPYTPLVLQDPADVTVNCNGDSGSITLQLSGSTPIGTETYEIISAPTAFDPTRINAPQPDATFDDLLIGDYEVIVNEVVTGTTDVCPSLPVSFSIIDKAPLTAPIINSISDFTCNDLGSITVVEDNINNIEITATTDFGGTPPYRFELLRNGTPIVSPGLLVTELPFTNLNEGSYTVRVIDNLGCPAGPVSVVPVVYEPLPNLIIDNDPIPIIRCGETTVSVQVSDTPPLTNGESISYRIEASDNLAITPDATDTFPNTDGQFDLPPGNYEIIGRTNTSLCTSNTLSITVEPLNEIRIANLPIPASLRCRGDLGTTTAAISNFSTNGYTYELTLNGSRIDANSSTTTQTGSFIDLIDLAPSGTDEYELTVTDIFTNCDDSRTFTVTDAPLPPVVSIDNAPEYRCITSTTGEYVFSVQGQNGTINLTDGYQFSLDDPTPMNNDIPFGDENTFTVPAPITGSVTYMVSIRDANECPGNTIPVIIDPISPFTVSLPTASSQLCIPNEPTDPVIELVMEVSGTPFTIAGNPVFRFREVGSATISEAIVNTSVTPNTISIQLPRNTLSGTVRFEIFDENNENCPIEISQQINAPITLGTPVPVQPRCDSSGALVTTGASVTFSVSGGIPPYTYQIQNETNTTDITTNTNVTISGTPTIPIFNFNSNLNNQDIVITVSDALCSSLETVSFTPMYPTAPVAMESVVPIKCNGGSARVEITPNLTGTTFTVNDFSYRFNGGAIQSSGLEPNVLAGTFDYEIINNLTDCITTGSILIEEPQEITLLIQDPQNVTCDASMVGSIPVLGSITYRATGGFPLGTTPVSTQANTAYRYTLTGIGSVSSVNQVVTPAPDTDAVFNNLDIGSYRIEVSVIDGNSNPLDDCSVTFIERISPQPFLNILDVEFDQVTCADGVTLFAVVDGGTDPTLFSMRVTRVDNMLIVPSANSGDNVAKFGDPDFTTIPAGVTVPTAVDIQTAAAAATPPFTTSIATNADVEDRLFRFTNLPPGGTYTIIVSDSRSGCTSEIEVSDPDADALSVRVTDIQPTNTGACTTPSGTVTVTFDVNDASLFGQEYIAQVIRSDNSVGESATITLTGPSLTGHTITITDLPEIINGTVRVSQIGDSCSSPSDPFTISANPILVGPLFERSIPANCIDDAEITVSASGGDNNYKYIIVNETSLPEPDSNTIFPIITNTFSISVREPDGTLNPLITAATNAEIGAASQPNLIGFVNIYVQDGNNCVSGPERVPVFETPSPVLNLEAAATNECSDGPYTVNYTITNFDTTQDYDFVINSVPQPINEASLTIISAAGVIPVVAQGVLTLANPDVYNVSISASSNRLCTSGDAVTIFERLDATVSTTQPNCDNEFDEITIDVISGTGFDGVATRMLTYELFEGVSTTAIATINSNTTTATFTNGTAFGGTPITLTTGVSYRIEISDTFELGVTPLRSCLRSFNVLPVDPLTLPTFSIASNDVSCPGVEDGEIEFTLTAFGDTPPVRIRLSQYTNAANASAALSAVQAGDTSLLTVPVIDPDIDNDLPVFSAPVSFDELAEGFYVAILEATTQNCLVIHPSVIEIEAPELAPDSNFSVIPTAGICDSAQGTADDISATLELLIAAAIPTTAVYTYTITEPVTGFSSGPTAIAVGTAVTVDVESSASQDLTYTVTFIDSNNPNCGINRITIPIPACPDFVPPPVPLTVTPPTGSVVCHDGKEDFTITVQDNDGPLDYDYDIVVISGAGTVNTASGTIDPLTTVTGSTGTNILVPNITVELDPETQYSITVIDNTEPRSLPRIVPFSISNAAEIVVNALEPTFSCTSNVISASFNVEVTEGTGPFEFTLRETNSTGAIIGTPVTPPANGRMQSFSVTSDGTYFIGVEDANGCTGSTTRNVPLFPEPILATLTMNNVCLENPVNTSNPVEIQVDITTGSEPYRIRRFTGGTPAGAYLNVTGDQFIDRDITAPGSYNYEILDATGCTFVIPTPVVINVPIVATLSRTEPMCVSPVVSRPQSIRDGVASYMVTGGSNNYTYEVAELSSATQDPTALFVSNPDNTFRVPSTRVNSYFRFRITDTNTNCTLIPPAFKFELPTAPSATFQLANILCQGEVGSLTINAPSGGVGPYTYSFDGGTTFSATNFVEASTETSFSYVVRDFNGCESDPIPATILDNSIMLDRISSTNVICNPSSTIQNSGSITLTILRGEPNFTYTLLDAARNPLPAPAAGSVTPSVSQSIAARTVTFGGLEVGDYQIQVTDNNNCSRFFSRRVNTSSPVIITPIQSVVDCAVSPGTGASFIFVISGATGPFLIQSPADGNALIDPQADTIGGDNVFRFDDPDLPANVAAAFTPPIGAEQNYFVISGLATNTSFDIEVVDSVTNCNQVASFEADFDIVDITNISLISDSNCMVGAPDSGIFTVNFERTTGTATLFEVRLLDALNNPVVVNAIPQEDLAVALTGTTGTATFNNLPSGEYKVRINAQGSIMECSELSETREIEQALPLGTPRVLGLTNASCSSSGVGNLAQFNATVSGGIPPYTFALVERGDTPVLTDFVTTTQFIRDPALGVTAFDLYAMDSSGVPICERTGPVGVDLNVDREPVLAAIGNVTQCSGTSFNINVSVEDADGLNPPYIFDIDDGVNTISQVLVNPDNTSIVNTLSGQLTLNDRGNFTISVRDAGGCNDSQPVTVFSELEISSATIQQATCNDEVPSISVMITGGNTLSRDLQFSLFEEGVTAAIFSTTTTTDNITFTSNTGGVPILNADVNYTVEITENAAPNCSITTEILNSPSINNSIPDDLEILSGITCFGFSDGSIRLNLSSFSNVIGDAPITFELYQFTGPSAMNDAQAAIAMTPVARPIGVPLIAPIMPDSNVFETLTAGTYVGYVINAGCPTVFPTPIELVDPDSYVAPDVTAVGIPGSCSGSVVTNPMLRITVNSIVAGNVPPYSYSIDGGNFVEITETRGVTNLSAPIIIDLPAVPNTSLGIRIKDEGNTVCGASILPLPNVDIPAFSLPTPIINTLQDLSCTTTEMVEVSVNGNVGDSFRFEAVPIGTSVALAPTMAIQNPGVDVFTATFEFSESGRYEFVVTNTGTNCSNTTDEYSIEELDPLRVRLVGSPVIECFGDTNQAITFVVEDYTGFFTYELLGPINVAATATTVAASSITPIDNTTSPEIVTTATLGEGDYTLIVTATNATSGAVLSTQSMSCINTETPVTIGAPNPELTLSIDPIDDITCLNEFISIRARASQGTPPYQYELVRINIAPIPNDVIVAFGPINPNPNTTGIFEETLGGGLGVGTYQVNVRDSNDCTVALPLPTVTPNVFTTLPTIDSFVLSTPIDCIDDLGVFTAMASLGNAPSTSIMYQLFQVEDGTGANPRLVEEITLPDGSTPIGSPAVFNDVVPGIFGSPNFYQLSVTDQFGCVSALSAVVPVVQPEAITFNLAENRMPISCDIRDTSKGETAQIRVEATGGSGGYTYELLERNPDGTRREPFVVVETNSSINNFDPITNNPITPFTLPQGVFELESGNNFFRVTDANNCESFLTVPIDNVPDPIAFDINFEMNQLCPNVTGFVELRGTASGGVSGFIYDLVVVEVNGSIFTELPIVPTFTRIPTPNGTRFEDLIPLSNFTTNANATYAYRVTSGSCEPAYRVFEIDRRVDFTPTVNSIQPSCTGEEDAIANVVLPSPLNAAMYNVRITKSADDNNVNGPFTVNNSIERVFNVPEITIGGVETITNEEDRTVVFPNLSPGHYQLTVSSEGCNINPILFSIEEKAVLEINQIARLDPSCEGDNGSITFQISGGTPPYFYRVLDLGSTPPEEQPIDPIAAVWGNEANQVDVSGTLEITTDNNGDLLKNNNEYQVFIVDSGNEMYSSVTLPIVPPATTAVTIPFVPDLNFDGSNALKVCIEISDLFIFRTPNLEGFGEFHTFNCPDFSQNIGPSYDVSVTGVNIGESAPGVPFDETRLTYLLRNIDTGDDTRQSSNLFTNVAPGNYELSLEFLRVGESLPCTSTTAIPVTLDPYEPIRFVRALDDNGNPTGPPYELIGLNEYRFLATGGVPGYTYSVEDQNGDTIPVRIDLRGRAEFTIERTALYTLIATDQNGCSAFATAVQIDFIDIDVPNVFYPDGADGSQATFYPDMLTFGEAFENFPTEGVVVEEGTVEITVTTGGVVTGGTITGNDTTGATVTGGTTTVTTIAPDGTSTVQVFIGTTVTGVTIKDGIATGGVPLGGVPTGTIPTGVVFNPSGTTSISTTTGGVTTGGVTTGGITTVTTINFDRTVDVTVSTGSTITGGSVTNGVVTGGTITGSTITTIARDVPVVNTGGNIINPNDSFVDFNNIEVLIFDRYGRLLEEFKGVKDRSAGEGWDGTYQNKRMPSGDYWYLIKLNDSKGREFTGHFTLYRK